MTSVGYFIVKFIGIFPFRGLFCTTAFGWAGFQFHFWRHLNRLFPEDLSRPRIQLSLWIVFYLQKNEWEQMNSNRSPNSTSPFFGYNDKNIRLWYEQCSSIRNQIRYYLSVFFSMTISNFNLLNSYWISDSFER